MARKKVILPHRLANASGFALLADGKVVEMKANADGKLPSKRETPYVFWSPTRAGMDLLISATKGATRSKGGEAR